MTEERAHRNEVVLIGRVTSLPEERVLPSGDTICSFRVTVDRDTADGGFDVVDCTAWTARTRKTAAAWQHHDVVQITGALRRRFYRAAAGVSSACGVEVLSARRVATAPRRPRTRE